jgi:hypothetical protein
MSAFSAVLLNSMKFGMIILFERILVAEGASLKLSAAVQKRLIRGMLPLLRLRSLSHFSEFVEYNVACQAKRRSLRVPLFKTARSASEVTTKGKKL